MTTLCCHPPLADLSVSRADGPWSWSPWEFRGDASGLRARDRAKLANGIGRLHERRADEERVRARGCEALYVGTRPHAAFRDALLGYHGEGGLRGAVAALGITNAPRFGL